MRKLALLAVLALAPAPAASAAEQVTGFLCNHIETGDPTGAVDPDPWQQYGEIDGGPLVIQSGDPSRPVISATLTCSLQLNDDDPAAPDVASVSATGSGGVVYLPPTAVTFHATPADALFYCAQLRWVTRDSTTVQDWDYVSGQPGNQCCTPTSSDPPYCPS
jgi:hypothetical protein